MAAEGAKIKLKKDLAKFKEDCMKQGWEEDEVDEKVAEAYSKFPWYKYNSEEKKTTWIAKLWNLFLFSFIIYLACGAYLAKNRRLRKQIMDKIFDMQLPYHQARLYRFITLPFSKFIKLDRLTSESCLLSNPLHKKVLGDCEFCNNITAVQIPETDKDGNEMIHSGELFALHNVPGYVNSTVGFSHIKDLFSKYGEEMDDSICEIYFSDIYGKMSDYFQLSEDDVMERNLSIGFKNCEGYGTRFYRKLFTRPSFVPRTAEINLEKYFLLLQPGQSYPFNEVAETSGTSYVFQVQGEATLSFFVPKECHVDCTDEQIDVKLTKGQMAVFPNSGWQFSLEPHGSKLSIFYVSSYVD